jgi:AraC-like DNA-binding protein
VFVTLFTQMRFPIADTNRHAAPMTEQWLNRLGVYQETRARSGRSALAWRHVVGFGDTPPPHLVLPETRLSLVTETRFDASGETLAEQRFVFGPIETPRLYAPKPGTRLDGRYLAPEDARRVLGVSPDDLIDAIAPAEDFAVALTKPSPPSLDETAYAARLIRASRGRARMERVAERAGLSLRHLRRRMKQRIGMGPKTLARRLQVQSAIERADQSAKPNWADIALAAGFSDQAHLTRTVREFTGHTPALLHGERRRQSVFFNIAAAV